MPHKEPVRTLKYDLSTHVVHKYTIPISWNVSVSQASSQLGELPTGTGDTKVTGRGQNLYICVLSPCVKYLNPLNIILSLMKVTFKPIAG